MSTWWWLGLPGVVLLALAARPASFRSRFARDRALLLARPARPAPPVIEADLANLPSLMQEYLRRVGAVGRPRVRNLRVEFAARMRSSATAPWMPATATEYEFFDPPARLFHMNATRGGVPIDVYHRYVDGAATFQVRLMGLIPLVNQRGPVLTRAETVTLMNDIVVMAPAAVLDLPFGWQTTGERTLQATFTNAGNTVAADLTFDAAGDLVGFRSDDRKQEKDGRPVPWSTPISDYRIIDRIRIGARGDANWIDAAGEWTYGEFEIKSIACNVGS